MPEGHHSAPLTAAAPIPGPGIDSGHAQASRPEDHRGQAEADHAAPEDIHAPRWTFSQRLALVYGGISLVILLCAGAFTVWQASVLSSRNEELAIAETRRIAERVGGVLAQARQGVSVLAAADPLARGAAGCGALLNAAHLTMDANVRHLFVIDANHRVACSTLLDAIGKPVFTGTIRTAELTGRPVTGVLGQSTLGLGRVIGVGHPMRRDGRPAGVVAAAVAVEELRATVSQHLPEIEGMRVWLLDSAEASASLVGPDEPLPPLPDALHASFIAPDLVDAGLATDRGNVLIQARATDDLTLVAAIPERVLRAGAPLEVALPPLLLAVMLLGGMGALFWSVQRFVVAPLEAATRRLEAPDGTLSPDDGAEEGPGDVADLVRRLGATRATRDESIRLRDMLLREAHHRIKNHLALVISFLRLQERQLSDHAALQALRAAQGRMVAIGTTYELLHDGGGRFVMLDQMLERFARALAARDMTDGNATQLETSLDPIEVPADIAVKIGLVVNELATNALKYAFVGRAPGTVRIVLRRIPVPGGFTLHVSDDGAGMPAEPRRGLGMTVADSLLRSIDARFERLPGPGTAFLVTWMPNSAPRTAI